MKSGSLINSALTHRYYCFYFGSRLACKIASMRWLLNKLIWLVNCLYLFGRSLIKVSSTHTHARTHTYSFLHLASNHSYSFFIFVPEVRESYQISLMIKYFGLLRNVSEWHFCTTKFDLFEDAPTRSIFLLNVRLQKKIRNSKKLRIFK